MNGIEFKCFRESLHLDLDAIAQMMGKKTEDITALESSPKNLSPETMVIVDEVEEVIIDLIEESIDELEQSINKKRTDEMSLIVFNTDEDMKKYNPEIFEIIPSSMAHRGALWEVKLEVEESTGVKVLLVSFNEFHYLGWLKKNRLNHSAAQLANWGAQFEA